MKKILATLLAFLMLVSFVACNGGENAESESEAPNQGDEATEEKTDGQTDAESELSDDSESVNDTSVDTDTDTEDNIDTDTDTDTDADADTDTDTDTDTDADINTDSDYTISAVYPANGSSVVIANNDVYTWWSAYNPNKITSDAYFRKADIYYPNDVTLEWSVGQHADYYRVWVSLNEDMTNSEKYVVNREYLALDSLLVSTDYYWRVDAVYADKTLRSAVYHFVTADSPRCLEIKGVSNTRDIGGKITTDGMRVKQGMVYRGGALSSITEEGKSYMINVLGIRHDMDLRGSNEAGAVTVSPLGEGVTYHCYNGRNYVTTSGIQTEEGKAIFAEEMRFFANPDNYPVYVHCALGRDRTGTAIFVLEALLGVEKKDLYMDYELSFFSRVGCSMEGEHTANEWINTMKHWTIKMYDYLNTFEGDTLSQKTENYLLSIGLTEEEIQSIRDNLLEEAE